MFFQKFFSAFLTRDLSAVVVAKKRICQLLFFLLKATHCQQLTVFDPDSNSWNNF